MNSIYELATFLVGNVPHQYEFIIPLVALVISVLIITAVVSFILLPFQLLKG